MVYMAVTGLNSFENRLYDMSQQTLNFNNMNLLILYKWYRNNIQIIPKQQSAFV